MQIYSQSALHPIRPRPWDIYDQGIGFPRMTLVCALRGTDGYVLAADTKASETHEPMSIDQLLGRVTATSHVSKIVTSCKHDVAIGFAESDEARMAAEIFIGRLDSLSDVPDNPREELRKACLEACNFHPQLMPENRRMALCGSLLFINPRLRDWPILRACFNLYGNGEFKFNPICTADKQLIGYDVNSAIFFLEKYYSFSTNSKTVNHLALLAGHVILAASHLSQDRIEGLEIVICRKEQRPKRLNDETITAIRTRSNFILAEIERLLEPIPELEI